MIRGRHPRRARDRLIIARAKSNVRSALRRDGIVDVIGEANFAPTVERASSPTRRPHLSGQLTSAPNASVGGPTASGGVTRIRGMTDW